MPNEIGKVRQSAVIMNYGPGAIIDFRVPGTGAAVSVVASGLEQWQQQAEEAGASTQDLRRFTEKRLAEKLRVGHFRMPPIALDKLDGDDTVVIPLVGVRFPVWLQCPECNLIKPARKWASNPGGASRFCNGCSTGLPDERKMFVVPVRFVTSCRNGHLDEFPWNDWVHSGNACVNAKEFLLKSEGAGLSGLILSCPRCKRRRSMEHIFKGTAHEGRTCSGTRPWFADGKESCDLRPVTLQRGASNLYFPRMEPALVIPPWSEEIIRRLGFRWNEIETITTREERRLYIGMFWQQISEDIGDVERRSFENLVEEKVSESVKARSGNLRWDEYQQFMIASAAGRRRGDEFDVRTENVPTSIPHIANLIRVVRLREIRVLKAFTRIEALPGRPPVKLQPLSKSGLNWLPAIEVRGEGIFVSLEARRLASWQANKAVLKRAATIQSYAESNVLNADNEKVEVTAALGARYLLLHALAHVLMKQLALQCGYSSASLRELMYVGTDNRDMAGLLIYTATSDADGTLGGLQRQGESRRFGDMFAESIRANEWCSSDPLCITGLAAATESSSLAACHSCLLAPETSCQDYNRFLDRAMLVGTPEDRSIGFFSDLLELQGG
jgi:hypothetical protein